MDTRYLRAGALLALFLVGTVLAAQDCGCDLTLDGSIGFANGNQYDYAPGDTICLMAGERPQLQLRNWQGTVDKPLVFVNCGGPLVLQNDDLHYGLAIMDCAHIRVTGSGASDGAYGIRLLGTGTGSGLTVSGFSTHIELDHLEIAGADFAGIMCKSDPVCDGSNNRGQFTMENINIHHNYIHHCGGEGLYVGSSFYTGMPVTCNGSSTLLYPHDIKGLRIYDNVVEDTGWDGIQVGCATEDVEIFGNTIRRSGTAKLEAQSNGIQIGAGTAGLCYNNVIEDAMGNGIVLFGLGDNVLFNNVIAYAGRALYPDDPTARAYGIFCDDRATLPGLSFHILNNTIVAPKTDGIRFYSTESNGSLIANNLILAPGAYAHYATDNTSIEAEDAYIFLMAGADVRMEHNFLDTSLQSAHFVDAAAYDFALRDNSPAINAGADVAAYGVHFGINQMARPSNGGFDIGAFEMAYSSLATGVLFFEATYSAPLVRIEWQLQAPEKLQRLRLERSLDGEHFEALREWAPDAELRRQDVFEDRDLPGLADRWYYRLSLQDAEGTWRHSPVRSVQRNLADTPLQPFPNPADSHFQLLLDIGCHCEQQLIITDLAGRRFHLSQYALPFGKNQIRVDVSGLPEGFYNVYFHDGQAAHNARLHIRR